MADVMYACSYVGWNANDTHGFLAITSIIVDHPNRCVMQRVCNYV